MIAEVLIGVPIAGALSYALGYAVWANLRWPAQGRMIGIKDARLHVLSSLTPPGGHDDAALPVVMLHGASANAREWTTSITPALDRPWVAIDRLGLGHSAPKPGHQRLARQAEAVIGVLDALHIDRAIIVAHSLGSATALRLALDYPERVAGLVLSAPASHPYPGDNAWHVRLAAHPLLGGLFCWTALPIFGPLAARNGLSDTFAPAPAPQGYGETTGLGLLFRPWTFNANAQQVRATRSEFAEQAPRYGAITAPTIIITADKDRVVSPKIHAERLAEDVADAELITIPGAGHMPHQIRPDVVLRAVEQVAARARAR